VKQLQKPKRTKRVIKEKKECSTKRKGDGREWVGVLFEKTGGDEATKAERREEPEDHPD